MVQETEKRVFILQRHGVLNAKREAAQWHKNSLLQVDII